MKKAQHVVPKSDGGWAVRKTGSSRASKVFTTERDAVRYAKQVAQKEGADIYVHRSDGTVRDHDSYARDAHASKG